MNMSLEDITEKGISRRDFLKDSAVSVAGLAAGGLLTGCTTNKKTTSSNSNNSVQVPKNIAKTYDTDIVIVGLGMSGLAAAVQAALNGKKVIGLESQSGTGGNGVGVEGIFGVNSKFQKKKGIKIDPASIIRNELGESQWISNGRVWMNLVNATSKNIDWLMDQGVQFSGVVDNYLGTGQVSSFHWFKGGTGKTGYIDQMTTRAKNLGVMVMVETPAKSLIKKSGKIAGVYAQNPKGQTIQINAKAVILATGSYGENKQYIKEHGFNLENFRYGGLPGHNGDGLMMALATGARSFVKNSTFNCTNTMSDFLFKGPVIQTTCGGGPYLWVNQDALRFINEDFAQTNFELQSVPSLSQQTMYTVFDQAIIKKQLAGKPDALSEVSKRVKTTKGSPFIKADSLEQAANLMGLDEKQFVDTVKQYNALCKRGKDTDFGKASNLMVAIENPPYYIGKMDQYFLVAIGAIETNESFQCLDDNRKPIDGLYAVGTDGCMLYRNIYPINMPGTCNANNINSGRTAANHATAYIK